MVRILGVDFAPLNIPNERRKQTVAALTYTILFTIGPIFFPVLCVTLLFTRFYWLTLLYTVWLVYDLETPAVGGRSWHWLRNHAIWRHCCNYFPIRLVKTTELDPQRNYVLACHPHGIISCAPFMNFTTNGTKVAEVFPGIKTHLLTLVGNFRIPIIHELILWMGLCDVSKASIRYLIGGEKRGHAVVIVVGGAEEALEAHANTAAICLKKRKGFVKMALQTGADLVPVYSFGETNIFHQSPNPSGSLLRRGQNALKRKIGVGIPLFHGRGVFNYTFGLLPFRHPIYTVVGKPIKVNKSVNPTSEEIENLHESYIDSLKNLYDQYKECYSTSKNTELVIL